MANTGLAVIESRWFERGNHSVRPLFETVCGIVEDHPHAFRYDMFTGAESLEAIVLDIVVGKMCHAIYIASHGTEEAICGLGDSEISRAKFRNLLSRHNKKSAIRGVYFGSCLVASESNARFMLIPAARTNLTWVAGYSESVDWIASSAVDMIFWSKYLEERKANRSRRRGKKTELEIIQSAAREMKKLLPTVFDALGFNIYHRDAGGKFARVW